MKFGSNCPLNNTENQNEFMRKEIEKFYGKPLNQLNIDGNLKKEFCKICKNILC
jgi:hypothetical protein